MTTKLKPSATRGEARLSIAERLKDRSTASRVAKQKQLKKRRPEAAREL